MIEIFFPGTPIAQNHLRGEHSVEVESLQVANVCLKLYEKLKEESK